MLLMLPGVLLLVVVDLFPLILGVLSSFRLLALSTLEHWTSAPWVGLENFREAVDGGGGLLVSAGRAIAQSLEFSIIATALALVIGTVAALTVGSRRSTGSRVLRALYLVPMALPLFTSAYLWRMILLPYDGLLDIVRGYFGFHAASRFLVGNHSFGALVFIDVWVAWGFVYLFALAAMQSIPAALYEAAVVDGANGWQKFRYVVYPQIRKTLAVAAVLSTLNHFNDFTLPYVVFGATPPSGVALVPTTTYETAYSVYNFGLADAMAVLGVIAIIVPLGVYIWYMFGAPRRA